MPKEAQPSRPISHILTAEKYKRLVEGAKPHRDCVSTTEVLAGLEITPISQMSDKEFMDLYLRIATSFGGKSF